MNLRSSYTRYLREMKKIPSGSGQKKKKWHLADAMGFLDPYTGPCRKMTSNLSTPIDVLSNTPSQNDDYNFGQDNGECIEEESHTVEQHEQVLPSGESSSTQFNPKKKQRKTVAEIVAQPMADYLKVVTQQRKTDDKSMENPMLTFFKSLLPDTDLLNAKRKRQ